MTYRLWRSNRWMIDKSKHSGQLSLVHDHSDNPGDGKYTSVTTEDLKRCQYCQQVVPEDVKNMYSLLLLSKNSNLPSWITKL